MNQLSKLLFNKEKEETILIITWMPTWGVNETPNIRVETTQVSPFLTGNS